MFNVLFTGAAIGPLIAGPLTEAFGWDGVFYALMIAGALGLLVIIVIFLELYFSSNSSFSTDVVSFDN